MSRGRITDPDTLSDSLNTRTCMKVPSFCSIAEVARQQMSRLSQLLLPAFIWLALTYVLVVFIDLTSTTFTLDTCTRLGRYVLQELTGRYGKTMRYYSTLATLVLPAASVMITLRGG